MRGWSMGPSPSLLIVKCYFSQLLDKITARGWRRRLSCPLIYPLLIWLLYDPQLLSWTLWKRAVPKEGASSLLSIWLRGSNFSLISSHGGLWGNAPHMLFLRLTQSGWRWPPTGSHVPQRCLSFQPPFGTGFPGSVHQHQCWHNSAYAFCEFEPRGLIIFIMDCQETYHCCWGTRSRILSVSEICLRWTALSLFFLFISVSHCSTHVLINMLLAEIHRLMIHGKANCFCSCLHFLSGLQF